MKRISRDPHKFELIRIADAYARSRGSTLDDQNLSESLLAELQVALREGRSNQILVHGLRVQSMFAYVAGALGHCALIKEEDAGETYALDPDQLVVPDFRIVTKDNVELLIEVKNWRPKDPLQPYLIKRSYFERLQAYGALFGQEVRVAIYWSQFRAWTLLSPRAFELSERWYSVSFGDAVQRSEMKTLGDCMIGTRVPIRTRFVTDPEQPRTVGPDGRAACTIKTFELYCGESKIERPLEKQIAWFLIWNGRWPQEEFPAEVVGGELISFEFVFRPEEETPDQGFEVIGSLSQMISQQFNQLTAPSGTIAQLVPSRDPGKLGILIPSDYKGEALPLWRLFISPNYG